MGRRAPRRLARRLLVALGLVLAARPVSRLRDEEDAEARSRVRPSESVIEVVAVLRRHVPDDTYRFPPATDFTGRNVYRSSLLRLESIERIHADALRSGYMDPVVFFAKGRALERLRAYDLAAGYYREAGEREPELADEARSSAYVCEQISDALGVGLDFEDPLAATARPTPRGDVLVPRVEADPNLSDAEQVVADLEERVALLSLLLEEVEQTHYAAVIREEIERADEVRAAYFVNHRFAIENGQLRAAAELQRVVSRHGPSKNSLRHMLQLAALYDDLAHEYVEASPPESLEFDPAHFEDLVDPATQLYETVASRDGTAEKLEAARRLEAFLAFTLVVDRDRFTH